MKGKFFTNKFGKLSLRGEDGEFYLIGKSLGHHKDGDTVEFDITETTYEGKPQKWANAPKADEKSQPQHQTQTKSQEPANLTSSGGTLEQLLARLLKGVAAILNEQKETNRLLGEQLKKGGQGTNPVQPKPTSESQKDKIDNMLGDLPF